MAAAIPPGPPGGWGAGVGVPGLAEPATGRLQSIPERRVPILNDLHLRRGRWVEPGQHINAAGRKVTDGCLAGIVKFHV